MGGGETKGTARGSHHAALETTTPYGCDNCTGNTGANPMAGSAVSSKAWLPGAVLVGGPGIELGMVATTSPVTSTPVEPMGTAIARDAQGLGDGSACKGRQGT